MKQLSQIIQEAEVIRRQNFMKCPNAITAGVLQAKDKVEGMRFLCVIFDNLNLKDIRDLHYYISDMKLSFPDAYDKLILSSKV